MTKKQLRTLAKSIAQLEYKIQTDSDPTKVTAYKNDMIKITNVTHDMSLDDMLYVDSLVEDLLKSMGLQNH